MLKVKTNTTTTRRKIKKYGWIPDLPDKRDRIFRIEKRMAELPPKVDLREKCPEDVYDQGDLGSCTANAIAGALQFDMIKQGQRDFMPSRLFIYYNERLIEGTVNEDSGAMIRDGIKSVVKDGDCPESMWQYIIKRFTKRPTPKCYTNALKHQALQYSRILDWSLDQMKGCLASGFPFTFGFSVYESFEDPSVAETGVVNMPGQDEAELGGHAVLAVGYDDDQQRFIVRNSWGEGWGMDGYFTMPYMYLCDENLADDFWVIRLIE